MYYVTISLPGCPDITDSFYIDVQPVPQVSITGTKYVCKFDTIHLHAAVTPQWYTQYAYHWSPPTFLDDSTASVAVFTGGDSMKLVVTVTTPAGCIGIDSSLIVVYPRVVAGPDTVYNLCPHDSLQLHPTPGLSYTWHPATYLSDSLSSEPWVHAVNSIGYTAIAKDQHGCRDTLTTSVVIRPAGKLFLGDSVTIFPGEAYHIQPQTNCVSFAWFPHAGLNNPNVSDPVATPEISTKYTVHGWTEFGCEAVDSISIYYDVSSLIAIPNAFTPGASINKVFKLLKRGDAVLNYFRIFNRWGNIVFETTDINVGWDGNYKGKPQPFDVYVYQIEATTNTGKVFEKSGNVTLVR
jgi:gliding motility-associated-like protein